MSEMTAELIARLEAAHARVALWPERQTDGGFMNLIALRNLVPDAIAKLKELSS